MARRPVQTRASLRFFGPRKLVFFFLGVRAWGGSIPFPGSHGLIPGRRTARFRRGNTPVTGMGTQTLVLHSCSSMPPSFRLFHPRRRTSPKAIFQVQHCYMKTQGFERNAHHWARAEFEKVWKRNAGRTTWYFYGMIVKNPKWISHACEEAAARTRIENWLALVPATITWAGEGRKLKRGYCHHSRGR